MNKKSCEQKGNCCPLPLWAKIVLGIIIGALLGYGILLALGITTFRSLSHNVDPQVKTSEEQSSDLLSKESANMQAESAIKEYLAHANKDIKADQVVVAGDEITVDYIGRLNEQEVFDTSVKAVAEAAGIYAAQRNYDEGLSFTVGAGQMIPGFDEGVLGMKVGETKTISIPAEKAYGPAKIELPATKQELEEVFGTGAFEVGTVKTFPDGNALEITAIQGDQIMVIFPNTHPLGGKDLIFDITIKSIQPKA